jgi:SNF2 family DNA or RNA helicase
MTDTMTKTNTDAPVTVIPALAEVEKTLATPREGIEYLPHQVEGVRWMLAREAADAVVCRGGILADDMGLGKTFQTIGLIKNGGPGVRTLIVCPPALMAGWLEELRACGFFVSVLKGVNSWLDVPEGEEAVWLTTYPKAVAYSKTSRGVSGRYFWDRVVLDEGHAIRNGKANKTWKAAIAFSIRAERRWILSATPVQNGSRDWENLCMFLHTRGVRRGAGYADVGRSIMLRRTMAELRDSIAELPPPPRFLTHDLSIPATDAHGAPGAESRLFHALCNQLQSAVDSRAVSALIKLELYMRIQQFLVHPQVYIEAMRTKFRGAYPRPDWTGTATKWDAAMEQLEIAVRDSVPTIVFCNFRAEMDRVAAAATEMGGRVWSVRGGMGTEAVGAAVTEARAAAERGEPVVFVCQIVSGGVGLNLQFCRRILFLSQHWNPAVVHQAVGRAVRIRQKAVVDIHIFRVVDDVMDNLDRRMVQIHLRKIAAAKEVCSTLYEGYAPLQEEAFGTAETEDTDTDPLSSSDEEDPTGV